MTMILEAGVFAYGILVFGTLSLRWAVKYARQRTVAPRFRLLILMSLTAAFGLLGCAAGVQASVQSIATAADRWLFLVGLRESLHNLILAGGFIICDLLLLLTVRRETTAAVIPSAVTHEVRPEA